jgi:hypothetical protein
MIRSFEGNPCPFTALRRLQPLQSIVYLCKINIFFFFFFKISPSAVELARLLIDYTYLTYFARLCCAIGENAHCVAT